MKKTIVKKAIFRKLNTAQFENVDVHVEVEEEIEWNTDKEKLEKTEKISKALLIDFNRTLIQTLEQLNLRKKIASVNGGVASSSLPENSLVKKSKKKGKSPPVDDDDDDYDVLDF